MKRVVVVVERGMVTEMYKSPDLELDDIEVIDLDTDDPERKQEALDYLNEIARELEVI